jgi:hypothetical protein
VLVSLKAIMLSSASSSMLHAPHIDSSTLGLNLAVTISKHDEALLKCDKMVESSEEL